MAVRISICVPTYNRAGMLPRAIDSALVQMQEQDELLIVDNCSTDATPEVLRKYSDRRMRVIPNEATVSMYANHNRCVDNAQGEWIVFLHSDDVLAGQALDTLRKYMSGDAETVCFYPVSPIHDSYTGEFPVLLKGAAGIAALCRWPTASPSGAAYRTEWMQGHPFGTASLASDLQLFLQILKSGGAARLIRERTVDMGTGAFQASHQWYGTGRFIHEAAQVFAEMVQVPGVVEAVGEGAPQWTDEEIARYLLFLSHANQREAMRDIRQRLGAREGYKKLRVYRHVRLYDHFGFAVFQGAFRTTKLLRRLVGR